MLQQAHSDESGTSPSYSAVSLSTSPSLTYDNDCLDSIPPLALSSPPPSPFTSPCDYPKYQFIRPIDEGEAGVYLVRNKDDPSDLRIFKPRCEEAFQYVGGRRSSIKRGLQYGVAYLKEQAAWILDMGFAGVPHTKHGSVDLGTSTSFGSLQEYRPHVCSCEDMGTSRFSIDDVHRIGILDIRLLNLDRHLGNILVQEDGHLVPIDHGYVLPSIHDIADVFFEWLFWSQCKVPFSAEEFEYIIGLNPRVDARALRELGIPDDVILAQLVATLFLQCCTKRGKTLFEIGRLVQRTNESLPSQFESVVQFIVQGKPPWLSRPPENFLPELSELVCEAITAII